ncbi:MAG: YihY/virulence factor BrkB family protein [Gemmatimonadetes bacterium]|nr:MAG: YihY/virulence factor BrkB family protein [Gemmatimonadota bacterium]
MTKIIALFRYYWGGLIHRLGEHHAFLLSGGLAFSIFICILPTVLIIFSVLGQILETSSMQEYLNTLIENMIPYPEYAERVEDILAERITEVIQQKKIAGIVGILGLLIAASGLFSSMRTILNRVYQIEETKHPLVGKLRDLGMIALVMVFMFFSIAILPVLEALKEYTRRLEILNITRNLFIFKIFESGTVQTYLFSLLSFLIIFGVLYGIYTLIPYGKLPRQVVLVSAFWTALLWEVAKQLFGYYLANFAMWGKLYGTYVLFVVVAFWIYYSSLIFIIGAELGQLFRERHFGEGAAMP